MELFLEITVLLAITVVMAMLARLLKQPLIVGYILTGLIVGPAALQLLNHSESIDAFAKIGTTILLFIVGLNLSPHIIREVGKPSLLVGIGQILITSIAGFFLSRLIGLPINASLYIGIALTFSSTIIILKLLSDKGDLEKLYAKLSIGLLLVQDVSAALILIFISSFSTTSGLPASQALPLVFVKFCVLVTGLFIVGKFILPLIMKSVAKSPELLFLFSLAFGMGTASLFYIMGISVEIGALLAGVILSMTPFAHEIASRLKPLRDFFIVLFFISLGTQINIADMGTIIVPAIILSLFVVVGDPLIVIILMNLLGYNKRTAFLSALGMAQVSEFSLILITLGYKFGQIDHTVFSLVMIVALISITISTYLITHGEKIYTKLAKVLGMLEIRKMHHTSFAGLSEKPEMVLFGYHRVGQDFVQAFKKLAKPFVVVDFDPESIELLKKHEVPHVYGDAEDIEFLNEFDFKHTTLIVSTIPDHDTNLLLVKSIRKSNKHAIVLVISSNVQEAKSLYKADATYVLMPHYLGAQYAAEMIVQHHSHPEHYQHEKERHLKYLEKRLVS